MGALEVGADRRRVGDREVTVGEGRDQAGGAQLPPVGGRIAGDDRHDRHDLVLEALGKRSDDDLAGVDRDGNTVDLQHGTAPVVEGAATILFDATGESSAYMFG